MQTMKVDELYPHPSNGYYFDDIQGEAWEEFKKSIQTSGIIEPLIITPDRVIVSGHQRLRAAKELDIKYVNVEVKIFDSKDDVLRALIETNIRQRGVGNPNPVKFGRCLIELERLYGIRNGGDRKSEPNNLELKTQKDLADEAGISKETLRNYKAIANAVPEIQELIESGKISATSALGIIRRLPEEDQKKIASEIAAQEAEKVTNARIRELEENLRIMNRQVIDAQGKEMKMSIKIQELESREPEVIEKIVEVVPDDYEEAKRTARKVGALTERLETEDRRYAQLQKENLALEDKVKELSSLTARGLDEENIVQNVYFFCTTCNNFIGNVGGLVWLTERIADMPEKEKQMFLKAARSFKDWSLAFSENLERNVNNDEE